MVEAAQTGPLLKQLLADYCDRNSLILVTDKVGHAGFIETNGGQRRFFRGCHFDLNPLGAAEIADDKAYVLDFLKRDGFAVPDSLLIHAPDVLAGLRISKPDVAKGLKSGEDAVSFADTTGYPIFLKPNKGQEGEDVVRLTNRLELEEALSDLLTRHSALMVQTAVSGDDLRIMVLDGDVLCVLHRQPVLVVGDGLRSVEQLARQIRDLNVRDPRIELELARQDLERTSILEVGRVVELLANKNLAAGAVARDISGLVGTRLKTIAADACAALGLRYAGVDLIAEDAQNNDTAYAILEVNAAPGLNRYATQGDQEFQQVKKIYERVFDALTDEDLQ